ncbi:MAG: MarC family protein [Candidatus Eremiobacteraeota bacterium]|nr:MarC family protein [Candidatus Eremiobacteraeota bacterium]MBV8203827.1 MarC family protein [Candidatus Eremiobacteraeota bacterium]MBV8262901.1 MarC family protein [Candidatus Eremiobacteraeota bacterium]MBV8338423.1 MarC family protein [Candidatus Eremiobacteraeota bacterium]MBV8459659.1 MarC family protein [Candidatus Eremiobacteraeota bacterium]
MDVNFAATAFATAFTIVDPVGMVPATLSVTAHATPEQRRRVTDRAVLVAGAIIVFMALVGHYFLAYLGITLPAFGIAGGILLLLIAIDMLFARPSRAKSDPDSLHESAEADNVAVFPLAIPFIAGPGTIATVLLLINLSKGNTEKLMIIYLAYGAALLVTWLCMRSAELVMRFLTRTGVNVLTRLLGIIMAALAVQFILNGLHEAGFGRS